MAVTCTGKSDRRYRYYVCRSSQHRAEGGAMVHVRAEAIEGSVLEQLRQIKGGIIRNAELNLETGEAASAARTKTSVLLRFLVDAVVYDAVTSEVTIRLHPPKRGRHAKE
jgi:hypothetical protein